MHVRSWVLSCCCFVFSSIAFSGTFITRIDSIQVDDSTYREIYPLVLDVFQPEIASAPSVFYEYINSRGQVLDKKQKVISRTEWQNCQDKCNLNLGLLNLQYKKYSCRLAIKIKTTQGAILAEQKVDWGECKSYPTMPSLRADLTFENTETPPWNSAFEIVNQGAISSGETKLYAVLLGQNNKPIWSEEKALPAIESRSTQGITFENQFKEWHWQLGCSLLVTIDPDFQIVEGNKLNNDFVYTVGDCKKLPSVSAGDQLDLQPQLQIDSSKLLVEVVNLGTLFLTKNDDLVYAVSFFDSQERMINSDRWFQRLNLPGFGDSIRVPSINIPIGACSAEIVLNPDRNLRESNYENNTKTISICH